MNIQIVEMSENDLSKIDIQEFDDFWNKNILAKDITIPTSYYIIAKCEEQILGFAGLNIILDEAHIANIAVRKDMRRKSIGSSLLNALISKAQETSSLITLEVSEKNEPAINLYKKYHFSLVGKRKKYYNNTYDAYIMTKYFE